MDFKFILAITILFLIQTKAYKSGNNSLKNKQKESNQRTVDNAVKDEEEEDLILQFSLPNSDDFNLPHCGITRKKGGLIVGGEKAAEGEFPWIVSLQRPKPDGQLTHFCGGAILNRRWIISAAHCFLGVQYSFKKLKVGVGSLEWKKPSGLYDIEKIISHEDFDSNIYANDIALIKTTKQIEIKESPTKYTVNSICIPSNETKPTQSAIVSGWGYTNEEGEASEFLLKVTVNKYDTPKCSKAYTEFIGGLTPQMMCYAKKGKDACKGDSGGPLIQTINRRGTQIGIVSFGYGCARADTPGVYQDAAKYYYWIDSTIKDNES